MSSACAWGPSPSIRDSDTTARRSVRLARTEHVRLARSYMSTWVMSTSTSASVGRVRNRESRARRASSCSRFSSHAPTAEKIERPSRISQRTGYSDSSTRHAVRRLSSGPDPARARPPTAGAPPPRLAPMRPVPTHSGRPSRTPGARARRDKARQVPARAVPVSALDVAGPSGWSSPAFEPTPRPPPLQARKVGCARVGGRTRHFRPVEPGRTAIHSSFGIVAPQ